MVFCNVLTTLDNFERRLVTILILIDGFLQLGWLSPWYDYKLVTILILIDGFLQYEILELAYDMFNIVTILILIDGFLQFTPNGEYATAYILSQSLF